MEKGRGGVKWERVEIGGRKWRREERGVRRCGKWEYTKNNPKTQQTWHLGATFSMPLS